MSFQAMTWATEQTLPAMQKIVLLMMANRANHDTGLCYPSHDLLAKECGMERRSVINQITKLEEAGLVTVIRSVNEKGMKSINKYRLNIIPKGEELSVLGCEGDSLRSERDSLPKTLGCERDSLGGSERDSLGGSERDSHKPVTIEPIKDIYIGDDEDLSIKQLLIFRPNQVDSTLWESAVNARKKRKAIQSKRAINGFIGELKKCEQAGISMNAALDIYLQKTWKGINAEWIHPKQPVKQISKFVNDDSDNYFAGHKVYR